MSFAIYFNLNQSKMLSSGNELSSQVKFSADRQTDGQTETGQTICPQSINGGP